jgi:hypothetical protein
MGDKSHTKMDGNWQLYRSTRVRERKIEIKYVLGDLALRVRCFLCCSKQKYVACGKRVKINNRHAKDKSMLGKQCKQSQEKKF